MTYTFNDDGIFVAVPESNKLVIRRPEHMNRKQWAEYAAKAADSLNAQYAPSMKLVDILARELKAWPGDVGAITQSEDGELRDYYHCKIRDWDECFVNSVADDCGPAHEGNKGAAVTRAEWQAAVDAIYADEPADPAKLNSRATHDERKKNADLRLSAMIDMGWLQPEFSVWPLWPRQTYGFELAPKLRSLEPKAEKPLSRKECPEFLKSRIDELEAQNIELVRQSWLPNKDAATARDRIKDLESQLEQLTADNESLSDIVVQLDDNAIQVLVRARDGDGLYFTSKEGQKVSVLRSGD